MIQFHVDGLPIPQGSLHAFVNGGRAVVVQGGDKQRRARLQDWRHAIACEARRWLEANGRPAPIDDPVTVELLFQLPRPKSTPKRVLRPHRKPDLDKLVRAAFDALTGVIWVDDARVVELVAAKDYTDSIPGLNVIVEAL